MHLIQANYAVWGRGVSAAVLFSISITHLRSAVASWQVSLRAAPSCTRGHRMALSAESILCPVLLALVLPNCDRLSARASAPQGYMTLN